MRRTILPWSDVDKVMNQGFQQKKKLKVEVVFPCGSSVTAGDIQEFFGSRLRENVQATVEELTYYSEVSEESSVSTEGSTESKREYARTARGFIDTEAYEESIGNCYFCNVHGRRGRNEPWVRRPPDTVYCNFSQFSVETQEEELDSEIFGEVNSCSETIGTTDSSRSFEFSQSDLSFVVSDDESVSVASFVRKFIEQNDRQDVRLLKSGKRASNPGTNAQAVVKHEYEPVLKRSKFT